MKTLIFTLAILFCYVVVAPAGADTCLKQKSHMDEYYYGGVVTPEDNTESEIWFGGKKMAILLPGRIVIVDAERDLLIFANKRDSSYVETSLPFDWTNVVDEPTAETLARYRTEGTVRETGKTREILGRSCRLLEIETWIEDGGDRFNEREQRAWVTTDLPIDWEAYKKIGVAGMLLQNFDDALVESFAPVAGITLESDIDVFQKGFSVKSTEKTVEILVKKPDTDVYTLPSWFRKKDQLTMADLRG